MLWWEEIQEGVCRANQDTVAARRSECLPHCGCWPPPTPGQGTASGGRGEKGLM